MSPSTKLFFICLFVFNSLGCKGQDGATFNLSQPDQVIKLPKEVNEISGITYSDGSVYAIDDAHGDLFRISLDDKPEVERWTFGKDRDHEDVVLADGMIYVLVSNGTVIWFPEKFPIDEVDKVEIDKKGSREFESLYFDPAIRKVVMLCKDCAFDKKDENSALILDTTKHSFSENPAYVIEQKEIEEILGKKIGRFKPSSATIDPVTGDLYIISSINKILVIMRDKSVKEVIPFKRELFEQPEGICFSPSGKLIISNEAGKRKNATILVFSRK